MPNTLKVSLEKAKVELKELIAAKKTIAKLTVKQCKLSPSLAKDIVGKHGLVLGKTISTIVLRCQKQVVKGDGKKFVELKKQINLKINTRKAKIASKVEKLKKQLKEEKLKKKSVSVRKGRKARSGRRTKNTIIGGAPEYMKSLFEGGGGDNEFAELIL